MPFPIPCSSEALPSVWKSFSVAIVLNKTILFLCWLSWKHIFPAVAKVWQESITERENALKQISNRLQSCKNCNLHFIKYIQAAHHNNEVSGKTWSQKSSQKIMFLVNTQPCHLPQCTSHLFSTLLNYFTFNDTWNSRAPFPRSHSRSFTEWLKQQKEEKFLSK